MHNPYELHTWSKQYREDALREAQVRHFEARARTNRASGSQGLFGFLRSVNRTQLVRRVVPAEERSP